MITEKHFGNYEDRVISEYTLSNIDGMKVSVINYGATITKIITTGKNNLFENVVIGFDDLDSYLENTRYFGATIGRYCNRIANGKFNLDGKEYTVAKNNGNNSLHGGIKGFDKTLWNIEKQENTNSLVCTYLSKDGEEGLNVEVTFSLLEDNSLKIDYTATTDKPTPVNLTNDSYFNLSAGRDIDILGHELQLFSSKYTAVTSELIPTGEILSVKNTPLDFTVAKKIGKDISAKNGGYDHNMIINDLQKNTGLVSEAASVYDPSSGRLMEMFTTEPAVQFYSGNFLNTGISPLKHSAFCLEAQHYPNSPNEPSFPNTILRPRDVYRQTTVYKFSIK